jgi:multidrug resistance efflux pump
MVLALQSLNGGTPSVRSQLSQYQAQLQQARQEASRAADRVARLEQQTEVARSESVRADERVRGIEGNPPRSTDSSASERPARRAINSLSMLSGSLLDETA